MKSAVAMLQSPAAVNDKPEMPPAQDQEARDTSERPLSASNDLSDIDKIKKEAFERGGSAIRLSCPFSLPGLHYCANKSDLLGGNTRRASETSCS